MKLNKLTLTALILGTITLTGCEADFADKTRAYHLPKELAHCTVYRLVPDVASTATNVTVVHCPRRDNT